MRRHSSSVSVSALVVTSAEHATPDVVEQCRHPQIVQLGLLKPSRLPSATEDANVDAVRERALVVVPNRRRPMSDVSSLSDRRFPARA